MERISRRALLGGAGASLALTAACGNGVGGSGAQQIDARVSATRNFLFSRYPGTQDLAGRAAGVLYMPLITEVRARHVTDAQTLLKTCSLPQGNVCAL